MSYLNILLQVEVIVLNYILACMPAAALVHFSIFPTKTMCKICCSVFVCCVNSRWSTWVVRVGAPRKIFKPPIPKSQDWACGPSAFLYNYCILKDYLLNYFSRSFMVM